MMTEIYRNKEKVMPKRGQLFVVMHAHRIWKGLFFWDLNEAQGAIRGSLRHTNFKSERLGQSLILIDIISNDKYIIQPIDEFMGMEDVKPNSEYKN